MRHRKNSAGNTDHGRDGCFFLIRSRLADVVKSMTGVSE
jgi:hypothetical protein